HCVPLYGQVSCAQGVNQTVRDRDLVHSERRSGDETPDMYSDLEHSEGLRGCAVHDAPTFRVPSSSGHKASCSAENRGGIALLTEAKDPHVPKTGKGGRRGSGQQTVFNPLQHRADLSASQLTGQEGKRSSSRQAKLRLVDPTKCGFGITEYVDREGVDRG